MTKRLPTINLPATGNNIKNLRISSGLSVSDLKRILNLSSVQAIYKWQQGLSLPSVDNLVSLSTLFNVKIDEIIVKE